MAMGCRRTLLVTHVAVAIVVSEAAVLRGHQARRNRRPVHAGEGRTAVVTVESVEGSRDDERVNIAVAIDITDVVGRLDR